MDSKIIKIIPIYRDGKKVLKKSTFLKKVPQKALQFCGTVKALQGAQQITPDLLSANKLGFNTGDLTSADDETLDSIVMGALYDTIENNKARLIAAGALTGNGHELTEEGLLAGYGALLSSLQQSIKALIDAHEALIGRYRALDAARGEKLAAEAAEKKAEK